MMNENEFFRMLGGLGGAVRVSDGRVFVRDGDDSARVKKIAGRGGPERGIEGVWCDDEECVRSGFVWEMFTGLTERVQFLVWCRKFLKDGSMVEEGGFYQRV